MSVTTSSMLIRNLSVIALQGLNQNIYGVVNARSFDLLRRTARIVRYAGRVDKAAQKGKSSLEYHLTMAFSWNLALANGAGFILGEELWKRFPGHCSHCFCGPCKCGRGIRNDSTLVRGTMPNTLHGFQKMFAAIYPTNTLLGETDHLLQEVCELTEAVDNYTGTNRPDLMAAVIAESCDVAAHICGVASCADIDLSVQFEEHFKDGCFSCHRPVCNCDFPATVTVT